MKKINTLKAAKEKDEMIKKIEELKHFVLLEEKRITNKNTQSIIKQEKTKTQRIIFFAEQKSALKNALKLHDKRSDIINALINKDIYSGDVEKYVYLKV